MVGCRRSSVRYSPAALDAAGHCVNAGLVRVRLDNAIMGGSHAI